MIAVLKLKKSWRMSGCEQSEKGKKSNSCEYQLSDLFENHKTVIKC